MRRSVQFFIMIFLSMVAAVLAARLEPSGAQEAWSAYPPPPSLTPSSSPRLEQIALKYVAALEATPVTELVIANQHNRRYVLTGRNLQAMTVLSHRTGRSYHVLVDPTDARRRS